MLIVVASIKHTRHTWQCSDPSEAAERFLGAMLCNASDAKVTDAEGLLIMSDAQAFGTALWHEAQELAWRLADQLTVDN